MSFTKRILSTLWNSVAGHVRDWANPVLRFLWNFFPQNARCKTVLRSLIDRVKKVRENPDRWSVYKCALNSHQFVHRQFGRFEPITVEIDAIRERLDLMRDRSGVDDEKIKDELKKLEHTLTVALKRLEDRETRATGRPWDKAWVRAPLAVGAITASIAAGVGIDLDPRPGEPERCPPSQIVEIDESTGGVAGCVSPPPLTPTPTLAPTPTPTSTPKLPAPPERLEECPTMSRMQYPFCYLVAPGENPSQIIAHHLRNYPELEAVSDCDIEEKIERSSRLLLSENARPLPMEGAGAIINTGDFIVVTKPVCPDEIKPDPPPLPFYLDDFVSRFRTALETALREPSDQNKAALTTYADDDSGDIVVEFIDAFTSKNPLRGRNCLILDDVYRAIVERGDGYHEIWLVLSAAVEFPDGGGRPLRRENPPILVRLLLHHDGITIIADIEVHDNHPDITFRADSFCPAI